MHTVAPTFQKGPYPPPFKNEHLLYSSFVINLMAGQKKKVLLIPINYLKLYCLQTGTMKQENCSHTVFYFTNYIFL